MYLWKSISWWTFSYASARRFKEPAEIRNPPSGGSTLCFQWNYKQIQEECVLLFATWGGFLTEALHTHTRLSTARPLQQDVRTFRRTSESGQLQGPSASKNQDLEWVGGAMKTIFHHRYNKRPLPKSGFHNFSKLPNVMRYLNFVDDLEGLLTRPGFSSTLTPPS